MPLLIPLSRDRGPIFRQVYAGLRDAILRGALQAGEKLPSTRAMSEQLGISRTVVVLAYEQLLAEGFVSGRSGSGTYVSEAVSAKDNSGRQPAARVRLSHFGGEAASAWPRITVPVQSNRAPPYDFAYGRSDLSTFPFEAWRRILMRCARRASVTDLGYRAAAGNDELREAICAHLRRNRGVVCDSSQVIVVSGSQQAVDLTVRILVDRGDAAAIENPSYQGTREALRAAGANIVAVPLDDDGIDPSRLPHNAQVLFVTPSHQFPTGAVLPLHRRLELLSWAKNRNAMIVEDDYDGEFRYDGHPIESMQGLDREGRVIYIGTFSRTVFPALRIGYVVVPQSIVEPFSAAKWLCDRHTAGLEQAALAEFLTSGLYERYLRRVRRRNASRRDALLSAIHNHLGSRVAITGDGAGAHVILWPTKRTSEEAMVAAAAKRGVGISGVAPYFIGRPQRPGILLGYARLSESEIREGVRRLSTVL